MARKSVAALAVVTPLNARPEPPSELTDDEKAVWRSVVATKPADWFTKDTHPLLVQYCRATSRAQAIANMIAQAERELGQDFRAVGIYKDLMAMEAKQSALIASLATKMRLSQQSKYGARGAETAARASGPAAKPWEFGKSGS